MLYHVLLQLAVLRNLVDAVPLNSTVHPFNDQATPSLAIVPDQLSSVSELIVTSTVLSSTEPTIVAPSIGQSSAFSGPNTSQILSPSSIPGEGANSPQSVGPSSFGQGAIRTGNGTKSILGAVSITYPADSTATHAPTSTSLETISAPEGSPAKTHIVSEEAGMAETVTISLSLAMSNPAPVSTPASTQEVITESSTTLTPTAVASPASASVSLSAQDAVAATAAVLGSHAATLKDIPDVPDHYSLDDVGECMLPPLDAFPVAAWPLDPHNRTEQEPSIALWFALRMDEWLDETFRLCPAALDTWDQDGDNRVPFSVVLGRLMFGMKKGAYSAITCKQSRCSWNSGEGWSRGDMFPYDSLPCIENSQCPENNTKNLKFVEQLRRWYTLQALGNVWDHKTAIAAAMGPAQQAVSGRMMKMINTWAPTFVAAKWNPPKSPFSAMFDIFKGVADFIPVAGPAISSALSTVDLIFPDAAGSKKPTKSDKKALEDDKNFQAVKDAIVTQAKGIAGAVKLAFEETKAVKEALQGGYWTPEHWDPVFDISSAESMEKFSAAFASMAAGLGKVFDESINGPPLGPNGFLTLIRGGLYSTWSMSADVMEADSLENLIPTYVAWTEDKLLQAIMRSYGIFFMHTTHGSQGECESQALTEIGNWAGAYCFPAADGTWRSLTPYTSNFGYTEVYKPNKPKISYTERQILHQIWPQMTAENIRDNLRGPTSGPVHPIDLTQIYQRLAQCFDATNANVNHRPAPHGSTTGFINFPPAITTSSASPLDAICHWNLPVVDRWPHPSQGPDSTACVDEYNVDGRQWTFWVDPRDHRMNDIHESCLLRAQGRVTETSCRIGDRTLDRCHGYEGWRWFPYDGRPGPALYYARALAYPANPDCVLNTDHIACDPF